MPVQVTYPGVYIEEIPSGQHVITGVATSITAFAGRAVCGPTDEPMTIFSFGDYERIYGGLAYDYPMSYAVKDFFLNGGSQAVIARLFQPETELSKDEWTKKANDAAQAVIDAVKGLTITDDTKPDAVVTAAKSAAAEYSTEPGKSAAQAVVTKTEEGKEKEGATAAGVKQSVSDYNPNNAVPVYPIGTLALSTYTWAGVIDAGHNVIKMSVDAMFDKDGNMLADTNPTAKLIYNAAKNQIQQVINTKDAVVSKFGRSLNPTIKPPAGKAQEFLGSLVDEVSKTMKQYVPQSASSGIETYAKSVKGYLSDTTKNTIDTHLDNACDTLKTSAAVVTVASILKLEAANPGSWGGNLKASVDYNGINDQVAQGYKKYSLAAADLFNLTVTYYKSDGTEKSERFTNVTIKKDTQAPIRLDRVLLHQSQFVRVQVKDGTPDLPDLIPPDGASGQAQDGGDGAYLEPLTYIGNENQKTGIYMLKKVDLFNLLCIPPDTRGGNTNAAVYTEALTFCVARRAMLIADPPVSWTDNAKTGRISDISPTDNELGINGPDARNAAVYFPRVIKEDLERNGLPDYFPVCGSIAGVMAATDVTRGVWKAPAGQNAAIVGIKGLEVNLTDQENGILNPLGINCLRSFPIIGPVVWGARTLRGADQLSDDYKYVPVRRLTLYVEESIYRSTQWAVFEPNDEKLWSSLRLSIGTFLADLQRQGAFYTYSVACDSSTTTQSDIDKGIVNIVVSIAPVKPAEFVVIQIQQVAGQKAA